MFGYSIDWAATGTWILAVIGAVALSIAWKQIEAHKEVKRNENTMDFIRRFGELESTGIANTACIVVSHYNFSQINPKASIDARVFRVLLFFLELSHYYHNGLINKNLLGQSFPHRYIQIFDDFKPLVTFTRSNTPYAFEGWEYMVKDMRNYVKNWEESKQRNR